MPSDLQMMKRHARALFTHDSRGRLRLVNELNGAEAPRFFLGRTAEGNIWRFRFDLPEVITQQLEAVCMNEPLTNDLREEPAHLAEYLMLLQAHASVEKIWMGPAY